MVAIQALREHTKKMFVSNEPIFHDAKAILTTTKTESTESNALANRQVRTLSEQGRLQDALNSLHYINCGDTSVDPDTYASLLYACINKKALPQGKLVHAHIIQIGFKGQDVSTCNKLVTMYAKAGSIDDAHKLFDEMPERNAVSWTVMIAAYARKGFGRKALTLFDQMLKAGVQPNQYTFASVLPAWADLAAMESGKEVHEDIIRRGFQSNVFVGSALVDMYVKCGNLGNARKMFDEMPDRNVVSWTAMVSGYAQSGDIYRASELFQRMPERNDVSWNAMVVGYLQNGLVHEAMEFFWLMPDRNVVSWTAMIAGCAQNGHDEEALTLFYQMRQVGIKPNQFTFASVLPACANLASLEYGRKVHEEVIRHGFESNVFVGSALVDMYIKCGSIENACEILDKMPERNVVAGTAMISGYAHNGLMDKALKLFQEMPERNVVTWNAMIAGYAQNGLVDEALKFFENMPARDLCSWTAMIQGYMQHGHTDKALELFWKMPKQDVVSWTAMISGYAQNGMIEEALEFFHKMPERDVASWNAMIAGYIRNCHVDEALKLFLKMPKHDVVSWNVMVAGFAQHGYYEESLKLFRHMQIIGVNPNANTFSSILPACVNLSAMAHGKEVHEDIVRNGFNSDVVVGNALVDMYAKCGSIYDAQKIFNTMPTKNVVSWNTIIVGYAMHGHGKQALQLFEQMQHAGINSDRVTFIGILSACCHAGLVDDGWRYFDSMSRYYHITPAMEHFCCMVDLLGRAGYLDEAEAFINKMPIEPDANVWGSLLGACRIYNNLELGERAALHILELNPKNSAPYVLLSNIYAATGKWDEIPRLRKMMIDNGVEKKPGCSWIEVNKHVHAFLVGN